MPLCCLTEGTSVHASKADDLWWRFALVGISHGNIYSWVWPKALGIVMSAKSKQDKIIYRGVASRCTLRTNNYLCFICVVTVQARRTLKEFAFSSSGTQPLRGESYVWRKSWEGLLLHGVNSSSASRKTQLCKSSGEEILAKVPAANWAVHIGSLLRG